MRVFWIFAVLACIFVTGCNPDSEKDQQAAQAQETEAGETLIYYTCPMAEHKDVHSDAPGACSKCGMALVKAVTTSVDKMEFYGCPMEAHSHVRGDAPGTCPECSMALKPMRLVKNTD
jgi:hypothetical protein